MLAPGARGDDRYGPNPAGSPGSAPAIDSWVVKLPVFECQPGVELLRRRHPFEINGGVCFEIREILAPAGDYDDSEHVIKGRFLCPDSTDATEVRALQSSTARPRPRDPGRLQLRNRAPSRAGPRPIAASAIERDVMSNPSCIFYAATNGGLRRHALRLEAEGTIELGHVTAEPSELLAAVGAQTPDLVIADLGDDAERVLDMLDKLPTPRPRLIVIGPKDQSSTILRAMRMGVRDYLDADPSEDDLRSAVLRVAAELAPRAAQPRRRRRIPRAWSR